MLQFFSNLNCEWQLEVITLCLLFREPGNEFSFGFLSDVTRSSPITWHRERKNMCKERLHKVCFKRGLTSFNMFNASERALNYKKKMLFYGVWGIHWLWQPISICSGLAGVLANHSLALFLGVFEKPAGTHRLVKHCANKRMETDAWQMMKMILHVRRLKPRTEKESGALESSPGPKRGANRAWIDSVRVVYTNTGVS